MTQPGQIGPYLVTEELGRGAMAVVYRAKHTTLDQVVALKLFRPQGQDANAQNAKERFFREARAMSKVSHPNVTKVYDVGEYGQFCYLAMEFLKGHDLESEIKRRGQVDPALARRWLIDIASGLAEIHQAGIIHRDLKPANIMICGERIVIADFGLVFSDSDKSLTATGDVVGTPIYMAPEQFTLRGRDLDQRSDIFSLGVIAYEMLCGSNPFIAKTVHEVANNVLKLNPPSLDKFVPQIDPVLASVVARCLEKSREKRLQTADHFFALLTDSEAGRDFDSSQFDSNDARYRSKQNKLSTSFLATATFGLMTLVLLIVTFVMLQNSNTEIQQLQAKNDIQLKTVKKLKTQLADKSEEAEVAKALAEKATLAAKTKVAELNSRIDRVSVDRNLQQAKAVFFTIQQLETTVNTLAAQRILSLSAYQLITEADQTVLINKKLALDEVDQANYARLIANDYYEFIKASHTEFKSTHFWRSTLLQALQRILQISSEYPNACAEVEAKTRLFMHLSIIDTKYLDLKFFTREHYAALPGEVRSSLSFGFIRDVIFATATGQSRKFGVTEVDSIQRQFFEFVNKLQASSSATVFDLLISIRVLDFVARRQRTQMNKGFIDLTQNSGDSHEAKFYRVMISLIAYDLDPRSVVNNDTRFKYGIKALGLYPNSFGAIWYVSDAISLRCLSESKALNEQHVLLLTSTVDTFVRNIACASSFAELRQWRYQVFSFRPMMFLYQLGHFSLSQRYCNRVKHSLRKFLPPQQRNILEMVRTLTEIGFAKQLPHFLDSTLDKRFLGSIRGNSASAPLSFEYVLLQLNSYHRLGNIPTDRYIQELQKARDKLDQFQHVTLEYFPRIKVCFRYYLWRALQQAKRDEQTVLAARNDLVASLEMLELKAEEFASQTLIKEVKARLKDSPKSRSTETEQDQQEAESEDGK